MRALFLLLIAISILHVPSSHAQIEIDKYEVVLEGFPSPIDGLHSFIYGSRQGKWIILAGRKDGLHARQPFASFPASDNNYTLYTVNEKTFKADTIDLSAAGLPTPIIEQLQSTNSQFFQDGQYLIQIGGYAFSASKGSHITYDGIIRIDLDGLLSDIDSGRNIARNFLHLSDTLFHVTGGALAKIDTVFYLIGGHSFTGAYNPMGHATYVQTYTEQIRKFSLQHGPGSFSFKFEGQITDVANLHRRDFSLAAQIFPNGKFGYTLFSGVFQLAKDLPFLQPVDITDQGHQVQSNFNQYLSNYHTAKIPLFDQVNNEMHTIFLGGMAQYYYDNGNFMQDNNVPFVSTISRVSRDNLGQLNEFSYPLGMPGYLGSSAEFIPLSKISRLHNEVILTDSLKGDTVLLGYMIGGIESPIPNAFVGNRTSLTQANDSIYKVMLVKSVSGTDIKKMKGENAVKLSLFPNPLKRSEALRYRISASKSGPISIYITDIQGKLLYNRYEEIKAGEEREYRFKVKDLSAGLYIMQVQLDGRYWSHSKFEIIADP